MSSLYGQLNYNWERGFYSVVKDRDNLFRIITTKCLTGFRSSSPHETLEAACRALGVWVLKSEDNLDGIVIVDTIHPSELMGKGFQVGDKVKIVGRSNLEGEVTRIEQDNVGAPVYTVGHPLPVIGYFFQQDLKPVLPLNDQVVGSVEGLELSKEGYWKAKEKKECEHKVEDVSTNIGFETNFGRIPLFLCKCGLVTCKNPNQ